MSKRHPLGIAAGFGALAILHSCASFLVKSDFNPLTFFRKSDPVAVANELLGAKLSGTQSMNLVLDLLPVPPTGRGPAEPAGDERTILSPRYLEAIDSLEKEPKKKNSPIPTAAYPPSTICWKGSIGRCTKGTPPVTGFPTPKT